MLTVFFDSSGMIHHEYAPHGATITKYYLEVLRRVCDAVRCKRPDLWAASNWQLHQDNPPAHSSHMIQSFLAKHNIPALRQALYIPDMTLCEIWLFPKLKMSLKRIRFQSREDIMRYATEHLCPILNETFQRCFKQWQNRWDTCLLSQGDYFEGDYCMF